MNRIPGLIAAMASALAIGAVVSLPSASAASAPEAASENWAGYVATPSDGSAQFSRVSGSWMQPSADATAGDGYSAFWVGLGGSDQSQSLEQIGTQADVTGGQSVYYAWYELVPAAPVKLGVAIHPGDQISASVLVSGSNVTVSLTNDTTGSSYTNTLQMNNPDASSAEWIAEAPSASDGQGGAQPLPLADFGTVAFSNASATAAGHTGSISDSNWTTHAVRLDSSSTAGAQPSDLTGDGSSFSATWQGAGGGQSSASNGAGGQDGYGSGYGGAGGYPGYGGDGGYGVPSYAYSY